MIIEDNIPILLNYGVLGLWTASLILDKIQSQGKLAELIVNNTAALTRVYEVIQKCQK